MLFWYLKFYYWENIDNLTNDVIKIFQAYKIQASN